MLSESSNEEEEEDSAKSIKSEIKNFLTMYKKRNIHFPQSHKQISWNGTE